MELPIHEIQQKRTTLRPTPAPKPTTGVVKEELFKIKLKSTKPVDNSENKDQPVNGDNEESVASNNHNEKPRSASIKDRTKIFENGSPGKLPIPAKPTVSKKPVKPKIAGSPVNASSNQNTEPRRRPPSVINKPVVPVLVQDTRVPELFPLPSPAVLGDAPAKPPKLWSLKQSLQKYLGTSHPPRPVVSEKNKTKSEVDEVNDTSPPPLEAPLIPKKPVKQAPVRQVKTSNEDHQRGNGAIDTTDQGSEDFYDDTTCSAPNVAGNTEDFYDDTITSTTSNVDGNTEDFYDDTTTSTANTTEDFYDDTTCTNDTREEFGEDLYEPIANQEQQAIEKPPPTPPVKDNGKEDKKKEKERKKKEKEEKERDEKERKKREKEKEKKLHEMKRRFSVRGNEKSIGTCRAAQDIQGNRMDISGSIGEEFDVIRKDKPNPANKWLVRNKQGQYGFIDINKIEQEPDETEELYEEVPASKIRSNQSSFNADHASSPPVTSPPPPPAQNAARPPAGDQDFYDDVAAAEQEDEELYEEL